MKKRKSFEKYYFDHPEIWEKINQVRFEKEPIFLKKIFRKYGIVRSVLDVGCGTGSHLNKLTEMGFDGEGIDLNKNMINYARKRHPRLKFYVKDMKKMNYFDRFDAIICLCRTFCYNTSNKEAVAALKSFHRALKKGGLLVIETFNPLVLLRGNKIEKAMEEIEGYKEFGLKSVVKCSVEEKDQQLLEKRNVYRLEDEKLLRSDVTYSRLFFPQETKYFLETSGFSFQDFYGNYSLERLKKSGLYLISVSKK